MQTLNPSEISELIKTRIEKVKLAAEARNEGTVTSVSDGIVRIHGLADVRYGEMIEFPGNVFGLALNLEQDSVGAVVLGEYKSIKEGDTVMLDQPLVSMETAKAVVEVPSPFSGVVVKLHGQAGDVIDTGAALASFAVFRQCSADVLPS